MSALNNPLSMRPSHLLCNDDENLYGDENVNSHPNSPIPSRDVKSPDGCEQKGVLKSIITNLESPLSDKEISPHRVDIKDRFAFAMKQQAKREQARIKKIKHNPRHSMQPNSDGDNIGKDDIYHSPTQKAFTEKFRQGLVTPNMLWSDAIRKLQDKQEIRHNTVRSNSQTLAKEVDTLQVASKRINQWEDHFLYEPTALELADMWQKVRGYLQLSLPEQQTYIQESNEIQAMILGSVKVMSCIDGDNTNELNRYFQQSLRPPTKYIGLRTAVQLLTTSPIPSSSTSSSSSPNQSGAAVPVKVIAMVCRLYQNTYAMFLTISPLPGYTEEDISYQYLQQPLLLKLYAPHNYQAPNTRLLLAQKTITVLPSASQAAFQDVMIEDFPINDVYDKARENTDGNDEEPYGNANYAIEDEIQKMIVAQGGDVCSPEIRAMTRKLSKFGARIDHMAARSQSHDTFDDFPLPEIDEAYHQDDEEVKEFSPPTSPPAKVNHANSAFSSPYQTVEGELPTSISPMIEFSSHLTPKKAWVADNTTSSSAMRDMNNRQTSTRLSLSGVPSQAFIHLDLQDIETISCTDKLFSAQHMTSTGNMDALGNGKVTMVTQALKTVTTHARCAAVDNRLFELSRGTAMSGMISKISSSSHGWGQSKRRFFVLKDDMLCYFKSRPPGDVFNPDLSPRRIYTITENTKLELCRVGGGLRRFWKISFFADGFTSHHSASRPSSTSSSGPPGTADSAVLYWHFKQHKESHKRNSRSLTKEERWIGALRQAIEIQRKKRETMALTLKTWWFHEGDDFRLIAMDAAKQLNTSVAATAASFTAQYLRVALFRTARSYCVDIITANQEKWQLELVRTNEQPLLCPTTSPVHHEEYVDLQSIKLYGDKLLLGGAKNTLFVGMLGRTTGVSLLESGKRVLYCIPVAVPAAASKVHRDSERNQRGNVDVETAGNLKFLACEPSMQLFVACDTTRNSLSFWHLDYPDDATRYELFDTSAESVAVSHAKTHQTQQKQMTDTNLQQQTTATPMLLDSPSKKRPGFYYHIKPDFQSQFVLPPLAVDDNNQQKTKETILQMQFLSDQQAGYLLVSTNYRLLLLLVTAQEKTVAHRHVNKHVGDSAGTCASTEVILGVSSYVVLDAVDVRAGQIGVFGVATASAGGLLTGSHASSQSLSEMQNGHNKLILWRLVQESPLLEDTHDTNNNNNNNQNQQDVRLCYVVRKEIEKEYLQDLLCHAVPV